MRVKGKCESCLSGCNCHGCKANDICVLANHEPCIRVTKCPRLNIGYLETTKEKLYENL